VGLLKFRTHILAPSFCDIIKISHLIMTYGFCIYMKLQLSAKMKIRPGMLEGFKNQAAQCISGVKRKDTGTLQYDWFVSSDNTECEIRETYEIPIVC